MTSKATSPKEYIDELPEDRKAPIQQLRQTILEHLPEGFEEQMSYGMLGYVVPHSRYPDGYHCDPKQPLPFMSLASQKNHIGLYHMGLYSDPELLEWFKKEYAEKVATKLDMGKSCIRFKNPKHIPFELIGELTTKMTATEWIDRYEKAVKR